MIRSATRTLAALLVLTGAPAVHAQEAASPADVPGDLPFIGSVSAADPRAEAAGMAMLKRGGSATDAAIAMMLTLGVVEPHNSGIGGGGFLVHRDAVGEVRTLDYRESAPAKAQDMGVTEIYIEDLREEFVADFVGSEKSLRRLSVVPLRREHLEPLDGVRAGQLGAAIDLASTLEEALTHLLRDDRGMVGVRDGAQFVGVLTPDGVHRALRASLAEKA